MEIIEIIASIFLYQIFWHLFIGEFKVKNMWNIVSIVLTFIVIGIYYYFSGSISLNLLPYALNLLILINLSIVDCKYYEISGKSYFYLLLPTIAILILNHTVILEYLISFIIVFVFFWIVDKLFGVEKIGGADVKILMILSLTIPYFDSVTLLALSFIIDVILFLGKLPIDKIRKKQEKTKIPMIVSITVAWIIVCFMNV